MTHFQILYNNGDALTANSIEERDAYTTVLKNIGVEYTVEEQYLVALVRFQNSDKIYTYFTDKILPDGSLAVVEASEWRAGQDMFCYKVVNVVRCTMRTKEDLEKVCPLTRYKKIYGTVNN